MKYFIGIIVALLVLGGALLGILAIWDISLVSWDLVWKVGLSIVIFMALMAVAVMVWGAFFKSDKYDKQGNNSHPLK